MNYTSLLTGLFALTTVMPAMAQKRKNAAKNEPVLSVEQLIQQYRFDEARNYCNEKLRLHKKQRRVRNAWMPIYDVSIWVLICCEEQKKSHLSIVFKFRVSRC